MIGYIFDDGGGGTGSPNCTVRAIAIATGLDYDLVEERCLECINEWVDEESGRSWDDLKNDTVGSLEHGTPPNSVEDYLIELGFTWHRCGLGDDPLPMSGRLIVEMPGHYTTVIDGVVHDTWDCRGKPVESYWVMDWIAAAERQTG